MSATTGPVLAAAGIVIFNHVIVQNQSPLQQTPIAVSAVIAAAGLNLWERAMPRTATAVAWLVLLSVLVVRANPLVPSPIESFGQWYQGK